MDVTLLKKLRGKYRLVQTNNNDWLWEKKEWLLNSWSEAGIGSHEYGYYHKSRGEAILKFMEHIHNIYRKTNYKRKRVYMI